MTGNTHAVHVKAYYSYTATLLGGGKMLIVNKLCIGNANACHIDSRIFMYRFFVFTLQR